MTLTPPQIIQYSAYLLLLIIAGALEYINKLPSGSAAYLFFLIVGHFFGNTPTVLALNQNTIATKENTAATGAALPVAEKPVVETSKPTV